MKKSILLFAVALGMLTSCDPIKDSKDMDVDKFTSASLLDGATFSQYADAGCTTPQADGNWIKYSVPKASSLYIYYLKADGSEFKLAGGQSAGVFNFVPSRGSDPNQTVYFKYINADLEEVVASKDFTVQVAAELKPEIRLLASNDYGSKIWKWNKNAPDGVVWGNMGYCGGSGEAVYTGAAGAKWWGVVAESETEAGSGNGFLQQLQHTEDGAYHGDGDVDNSYMEFTEDGILTSYDASGNVIRTDAFAVEGYDPAGEWKVGDLVTKAILWPYEINSGGNIPGRYEICYLSADKMTLVYPDGGDFGSLGGWGEATFWQFTSNSDINGMAAGYDGGKDWTWNTEALDGVVWGNMGYCGGAGANAVASGKWWGVTSEADFLTQGAHTGSEGFKGDESMDAFMTLNADGTIVRHAGDGSVINSGTYEFVPVVGNEWKVADLNTTAGTILWPYEINSGGNMPTTFEVVDMSGSHMTLVYPDGGAFDGLGGWGEATFWQFKAK
jgi:hypothetical protein